MDNLYTKKKRIIITLLNLLNQKYLEDNYISMDQVQAGYDDKNGCDSKFALKTQITEFI